MTAADVVNEYIAIINKLEELRLLLKKKLIQLKAIDSSGLIDGENVTFPKLLTKVNPTDIGSIINKQLPNQPVDLTDDFVTDFKINDSLNSQYSIEDFNSLLIDKFNFYREYLMYQLENMGVSKNEINQAITIKNLILLLDKVDKIKTIDNITCDDTIIYINQNNVLDVYIYDETGIEVEKGTLEIYENGTCIYSENIGEEVIIAPTTIGEHTYNFKYVNKDKNTNAIINKYITSELFPITIDVVYPPLEGSFTLQNTTTTSKYYTGNEDDFIGYKNDKWNIDVNIFDINQNSINQTIPFNIYMYDDQHLVTSGVTDATGHVKLTNVTIPYTNSDFIDFHESAVTNFYITDEQQNNVVTIDDIDKLSFIKDPTFVDGKLTYRRVVFTKNNYLDDLNGCVIDVQQNNTSIQYTTFSTSEHTKLSEINNLSETIGHLITEIFYKTKTINDVITITELDYETLINEKYQYNKESPDYSVPLILKTTLDDPTHPNTELYHDINIYHIPLRIDTELTWYKSDPNIPSSIVFVLCDEETNQPLNHLEQTYKLNINGTEHSINSPTYNYQIDIDALSYGETNLNVTLYENNIEFVILNRKITLLSNFELPSQTIYYANDTPNIYYKPKGIVTQNKQVKVNNVTKYTNAEGLIHDIKSDNTIGTYNLTLVASSDDLTEQRTFSYEIKKPFIITRTSYDQYSQIIYAITFYDKEHVGWETTQGVNFAPNPENFINITNENNENVNYTYTNNFADNSITYYITVNKTTNTVGTNTLTVEVNGYSEIDTFEFELDQYLYELVTTEIGLGYEQNIQIKCNDPNVDTVEISGIGILRNTSKPITKTDDILTVQCSITQAAPNGVTVSMSHDGITEIGTLIIPKGNVNGDLYIESSRVTSFPIGQSTNLYLYAAIHFPINTSQTFIVNDGINNYTKNISGSNGVIASIINFKNTNRAPGTYTATLTYNGDSNFNSYTNSLTYTITAENCTITLNATNNFIDNTNTSSTLTAQYTHDETPIQSATLTLTLNGNVVDTDTTNSNGQVVFTITEPGEYTVVAKSNNETMCTSNTITINSVVEESNTHLSNNIILESNKNILSYIDNETATLTATIYDQHGDKIKNKVVKFYIVNSKNYSVSLNNVEVL